jgi:nicotinate phosphoribosyltransferase
MAHGTEEDGFRAFHRHFAEHTTLLIDTYDTVEGARTATTLGPSVGGVRLDSGDLAELSQQVRAILDEAGMQETRIIASSDLNEYRIAELLEKDAKIDGFGVGTEMVTSADAPSLSGVYKLVEEQLDGEDVPRVKRSAEKETYPGRKQVFRQSDDRGQFQGDVVALEHEDLAGTPLLVPVLRGGKLVGDLPTLENARERAARELEALPADYKALENPAEYPVQWSTALDALRREAIRIHQREEKDEDDE